VRLLFIPVFPKWNCFQYVKLMPLRTFFNISTTSKLGPWDTTILDSNLLSSAQSVHKGQRNHNELPKDSSYKITTCVAS